MAADVTRRASAKAGARSASPGLDDFRAAQIVIDAHGPEAEQEILHHVARLAEAEDHAGVTRWMNVLAAHDELRCISRGGAPLQ
jgi:hypothetical protein